MLWHFNSLLGNFHNGGVTWASRCLILVATWQLVLNIVQANKTENIKNHIIGPIWKRLLLVSLINDQQREKLFNAKTLWFTQSVDIMREACGSGETVVVFMVGLVLWFDVL